MLKLRHLVFFGGIAAALAFTPRLPAPPEAPSATPTPAPAGKAGSSTPAAGAKAAATPAPAAKAAAAPASSPAAKPPAAAPAAAAPAKPAAAAPAPAAGTAKKKEKHKAKAKDLIHDMERCVAFTGKALKTERAKDKAIRSKKAKAFVEQLAATSKLIDQLKKQVAAKDKTLFATARQVDQAIAATDTTFKFSGIKSKDVTSGVHKLRACWELYDKKFNRQALSKDPKKAKEPLDAKKAAQFAAMQKKTDELIAKLTELDAKLKKYKGLDTELAHLIAELKTIKNTKPSYGSYITALDRLQDIEGHYKGLSKYAGVVYPSAAKEFATTDTYFVSYEKDINASYDEYYLTYDYTTYDTVEIEYYDTSIEVEISESEVASYETYVETESSTFTYDEYSETEAISEDASFEEEDDVDDDIDDGGDVDETDDEIADEAEDMGDDDDGGDDGDD